MRDYAEQSKMMVRLWEKPGFRELQSKRVSEGMKRAAAQGKTMGRPKKKPEEQSA